MDIIAGVAIDVADVADAVLADIVDVVVVRMSEGRRVKIECVIDGIQIAGIEALYIV
jgi:hypothetical protein